MKRWLPVIVCMAAIFVLSSQPTLPSPPGFFSRDKVQHATAYAALGILVVWAIRGTRPDWKLSAVVAVGVLISAIYGMTDEFHQRFVPNRNCEVFDWLADLTGSLIGGGVTASFDKLRMRR